MKLRLPSKLVAAIMAAASPVLFTTIGSATFGETAAATETTTLGNVMYIGDSITNGHGGMVSWRWQFFKMLTDNGISQTEQGINTGRHNNAYHTQLFTNQTYGGQLFENVHSGYSSGRAWEISGRRSDGSRYDGTNIKNWLGVSNTNNWGQTYTGTVYSAENGNAIDNFFLLIGTNDLLSDAGYSETQFNTKYNNLLGYDAATDTLTHAETADIEVIYNTMKAQAPSAGIVMLTIPTTGTNSSNVCSPETVSGIMKYNELLTRWVADKNAAGGNIKLIDVNKGLIDVTDSVPTSTSSANGALVHQSGVAAFFNDGLHPSAQGELIIAGNVAKGMGIGGRTAGLERSAATADGWSHAEQTEYALGSSTLTFAENAFTTENGYTVDFGAVFGNGAEEGWLASSNALTVTIGDGSHTGTLNMSEGYIMWGSNILYSQDNHANTDNIRIAYHNGSVAENVAGGYYVWLGDMLIGEGLTATTGSGLLNGITLGATGAAGTVSNLSWANTAYAPTTTGTYNSSSAFLAATADSTNNAPLGIKDITWQETATTDNFANASANAVRETALGDNYTGAASANVTGDVSMKYADAAGTNNGVLSVWNATVDGNVYMEFDSTGTFKKWVNSGTFASVVGTYGGNITGNYTAVINSGEFEYSVFGGEYTNAACSIDGGTDIFVNGGHIGGSVYGGGVVGTISGGADVTVTGGVIEGSVYGGGTGGTINGGTTVTVTGGVIRGNVFGGMSNETAGAYTGDVTIESNHASIAGSINANNVTLKDVADGNYTSGFDRYHGAINATTQLTLDGYTAAHLNAAITTQGVRLTNNSQTTISNLHLTACTITAEAGSSLTLEGNLTLGNTATYSGNITVADGITFTMDQAGITAAASSTAYSAGASGFLTVGTVTLLKPAQDSELLHVSNVNSYVGGGMLQNATFSYNSETGVLSASPVNVGGSGTYYVNDTVVYNTNTEAYTADAFVIGNGGNLQLNTNLKDGVTVAGADASTTSTITVGSGVTLLRPTSSVTDLGSIASYVVNEGGVLDWTGSGNAGNSTINLSSKLSGDGTVKVVYGNGNHNGELRLGSTFTGIADVSGNFQLKGSTENSANTTFYLHDGESWYESAGTIANNLIFGGTYTLRPGSNSTLSGVLTSKEGDESQNLMLGHSQNAGKTIYFTNAGNANINKVTLAYDNLTLSGVAGSGNDRLLYTGDIVVNSGRELTLNAGNANSSVVLDAAEVRGTVTLNGTSSSVSKITYTDGSVHIVGGVDMGNGGYGEIHNSWDKQQYLQCLTGQNAMLTLKRGTGSSGNGGYFHVMEDGSFSGTIKLINASSDTNSGLILHDSGKALTNTVVDFTGGTDDNGNINTNKALLAFISGNGTFNNSKQLTTTTFTDGAVAGLVGAKGSVKAGDLTIAVSGTREYSGDLLVNKLTVSGTGSQSLTGNNTLSAGAVVESGATLALGGTTTLGGTVQNGGTLNLGGTVAVDTSKMWNYEVVPAAGGNTYSDGANGYLTDATFYLVKNGGTVTPAEGLSFTGTTVTDAGSGNYTFTGTDSSTYYINENLTYDTEKMDGATNLHIADGVILTGSTKPGSMKTLIGSGTYTTSLANISSVVSGTNADWTGTVVLDGVNLWNSGTNTNLNRLGNKNSWVKLMGVTQIDYNWGTTQKVIDANLILEDKDASHPAWLINQGSSGNGAQITYTLTGQIKGDGTIEKAAAWRQSFTFTGDVSGWTGTLKYSGSSNNSKPTVTFSGNATTINAEITRTYEGGQNLVLALGTITNNAQAYTFNNDVTINELQTNGNKVIIGKDATMTLSNDAANFLSQTIPYTSGQGTLAFTSSDTTGAFADSARFAAGGVEYTLGVEHLLITNNIALNNWGQAKGGLTIASGTEMTVNGMLRVESDFNLRAQGGLMVTDKLHVGHTNSGSAHVFIDNGAEVMLGGIVYNNTDANKTFEMTGGTLDFSVDGNVVTQGSVTNALGVIIEGTAPVAPAFSFLGGTLQAQEHSWTFNHAAKLGTMTLNSVGESTNMTISGVLSDADGVHGSITKTGDGTLTLSAANTFTGDLVVEAGTLKIGDRLALGAFNARGAAAGTTRTITINEGGSLDVNGYNSDNDGDYAVILNGGTLLNSGATVGVDQRQVVTKLTLTADSYVDTKTNNFGLIGAGYNATSVELGANKLVKKGSGIYFLTNATITGTGALVAKEGTLEFREGGPAKRGSLEANIEMAGGTVTSGNTTIQLGKDVSVTATAAGSAFAGAVNTNGHTLTVGGTEALTMSGAISGTGALVKDGANTITLSAANTFTGGTTIQHGTLIGANSNALQSSVVTFSDVAEDRVLSFESEGSAINGTIAGLSGYRGTVKADTLTINVASGSYQFLHRYSNGTTTDAAVLDVNKLVKTGTGTQIIGGEYTAERGFADGLVIAGGIDVQQGTLHMKTRGTVKSNISVAAGATFKTTDDTGLATSAADAMHYNGTMTLNGTASNTATLHYVDGSTYIENGLYVDGYGKAIMEWDKTQFIGGFYSVGDTPAELTLTRSSHAAQNGYPRYFVVDKSGNFTGTIKLENSANAETFGIIAAGAAAEQSLAGAVLDMSAGTNGALVAFVTETSTNRPGTTTRIDNLDVYKQYYLTDENLRDGAVAGLKGTAGNVYAKELTITTADGGDYAYSGSLNVTDLVKTGAGAQSLNVTSNLNSLDVQGGTLSVTNGALTVTDGITIGNGAVLKLAGGGQQSHLRGEVTVGDGGKFILTGKDATGWGGGATSVQKITVDKGGEYLLGFSDNNDTFCGTLVLNGKLGMAEGFSGSRIDLYNGAKVEVSEGEHGEVAEGVSLKLRRDDTEFFIDTDASLTVNGTITRSGNGEGNDNFRKTGAGTMIINSDLESTNGVHDINVEAGALTLNNAAKVAGKLTVAADATLNIGAAGNVVVNDAELASVIVNSGALTLNGEINLIRDLNTEFAHFDNLEGDNSYGYLQSVTIQVATNGGRVDLGDDVVWKINGMTAEGYGLSNIEFDNGILLMSDPQGAAAKRWFMNSGAGATYEYTGAEDQEMTSFLINAKENACLTLNTGDNVGDHLSGMIVVNDTTAALEIAEDTNLDASKVMLSNGGTAVLTGEGSYTLNSGTRELAAGISLDETDWTGTVVLSGSIAGGHTFQDIATENSSITMNGVSTWLTPNGTVAAAIILNGKDNGEREGAALIINGANGNVTYTFSGEMSGSGDFAYTQNNEARDCTFKMTGDTSEWTGDFVNYNQGTPSLTIAPTTDSAVGAGVIQRGTGTLAVTYGEHVTAVNGVINRVDGTLNVTVQGNTEFTKSVTANTVTVAADKAATFSGGATLNSATLGDNASLNFTAGSSTLKGSVTGDTGTVSVSNGAILTVDPTADPTLPNVALNSGTLHMLSAGHNPGYTFTLNSLEVTGTGNTIDAANGGFHGLVDINALSSAAAGAELTLANMAIVNCASVFNINGGDNGAFDGTLHLKQGVTSGNNDGRHVAMNIKDADVLSNTVISMEAVSNHNDSRVALGIAEENVTVKGITTADDYGEKIIFSGAAALGAQSYGGDDTTRTLVINTGDNEETSYTANATIKGNLNLTKDGAGTQTFSGNMSAFDGNLTVTDGTLAITNELPKAGLVTTSGGTLSFGSNATVTGLTGTGGTINGTTASATLTVNVEEENAYSANATIGGNLNISKSGTGTQTLTGDMSAFNGNLTVTDGTLAFTNAVTTTGVVTMGVEGVHKYAATIDFKADSTIGGLDGHCGMVNGTVLTINATEDHAFQHTYVDGHTEDHAVLNVSELIKQGAGTQIIGGEYTEGDGLVIDNGVKVQEGTLHMKTRGTVTANFDVSAGATLKTSDNPAVCTTAASAMQYHGKVTLHGLQESGAATLNYTDGSTFIRDGLYVDGTATVISSYDKFQFIGGLFNYVDEEGNATSGNDITFTRPANEDNKNSDKHSVIVLTAAGDFDGTVHVENVCASAVNNHDTFGIQVLGADAQNALAHAVVDLTSTNDTVLAFRSGSEASEDWSSNKMDGTVAGLVNRYSDGGSVYADNLTVDTATGTEYAYHGHLYVNGITKNGDGMQSFGGPIDDFRGPIEVNAGTLAFNGLTNGTLNNLHIVGEHTATVHNNGQLVAGNATLKANGAQVAALDAEGDAPATHTGTVRNAVFAANSLKGEGAQGGTLEGGLLEIADSVTYTISDMTLTNSVVDAENAVLNMQNVNIDATSGVVANSGALTGENRLTLSAGDTTKDITADGTISSSQLTGLTLNGNLTIDLSEHDYAHGVSDKSIFHIELSDFSWVELVGKDAGTVYSGSKDINEVFKVLALGTTDTFYKVLSVTQGVGTGFANSGITLEVQVPEPATSVLSLLALAGMAARRRRK